MTGIIKTDQLQGAQSTTVTVPTGNTLAVTSNATVGGTLGVTGNTTMGGTAAITGNTTVGGTLVNTGLITASAGVAIGGTGSANTLDDYEEGTWTAVLTGSSSNPSSTVQTTGARYTKIGRLVFVQAGFSNVNTTGASGAPRVTGLPFSAGTSFSTGNVMLHTRFVVGGGVVNVSPFVSTTQVQFYQSVSGGAWAEIAHSAGTGAYLYFTAVYDTNS